MAWWQNINLRRGNRATPATYKTDPRCSCDGVSWPWAVTIWIIVAAITVGLLA
jgi:hypothetical protein